MRLLVTGGSGFIGSNLIKKLILDEKYCVLNIDVMTYASSNESLRTVRNNPNYEFEKINICNMEGMKKIIDKFKPESVLHLAAESHVDRSIEGPASFIQSNIFGTYSLLKTFDEYIKTLKFADRKIFKFIHVSTDEVFGSLILNEERFHERSRYKPNSPYSATKASSDHLVRAWAKTYGFPGIITNCSNNYGAFQHPEKLIPKTITNLIRGISVPIYGDGLNQREWIHVDDHCDALIFLLEHGQIAQNYLIGSGYEITNLKLIQQIISHLADRDLGLDLEKMRNLLTFVTDRQGHDLRYAINNRKLLDLGWRPKREFESGIKETIDWYIENTAWWKELLNDSSKRANQI